MILILTTLDNKEKLVEIGRKLLEKRLIACYNLLPIEAGYWWKGKIVSESGFLLILKTLEQKFSEVQSFIKSSSTDETPEIISIKTDEVDPKYLDWLNKEIH
ncbi:MAG TPA: divalent cation tolerance protein CutA [Candidatus Nanoarchaeia archaeon]|nr:divalent-cation tolerance protein CutA [uncultured archaeon]